MGFDQSEREQGPIYIIKIYMYTHSYGVASLSSTKFGT